MNGKILKVKIYGEPTPKGRPKVAMRGRFPTVYTPKKTRNAEESWLSQAINQKPEQPLEGPLSVNVCFYKQKPKSYPKKVIHWTVKPDIDNMLKLVLDAMNKIFFQDDSQIVELISTKEYDEVPRTEVTIRKL